MLSSCFRQEELICMKIKEKMCTRGWGLSSGIEGILEGNKKMGEGD
jgi:hypothetical protein